MVIPIAVSGFPQTYPNSTFIALGVLVLYSAALVLGWRYLGPLRWLKPLHHIWPSGDEP